MRSLAPACLLFVAAGPLVAADGPLDFARDIRPILSNACFLCHGPDDAKREADLRFDRPESALAEREGKFAIVPGQPDASEAIRRIASTDPDEQMPPPDSGKKLKPADIERLRTWIAQGARWNEHWAFVPPVLPPLPEVRNRLWVKNPLDAFVLARLEREGLAPSPEADKIALLRRLSLDLVGLPPTIAEVDAFLADTSADAYARQVERLLASPHYGERWARHWLDAARYADSDGFEKDKPRFVWFYRDWVVGAFNRDLPYDQFIVEQLAGDLLPNPTQDQIVATGFLRNSMINEEGGVDPEQFRMEAMFDRMDALGKGVLGLTIQCGQCHSHKYDPLLQQEYYGLFAFLNNTHEGSAAVYTPDSLMQRAEIFRQIAEIEGQLQHQTPDWPQQLAAWENQVRADQPEWTIVRPEPDASGGQKHTVLDDGSILASGYAPTKSTTEFAVRTSVPRIAALRLELLNDADLPLTGPGRSVVGLCALTEFKATAAPIAHPEQTTELKFARATADVNPPEAELDPIYSDKSDKRRVTGPIEFALDDKDETAWGLEIGPGRSNVPRKAVFSLAAPLEDPAGWIITFKLVQNHGGWNSDDNQNNNLGRFRFAVTGDAAAVADPLPAGVRAILAVPAESRTPAQAAAVFGYWRTTVPAWREANDRIEALWRSHPQAVPQLVLHERSAARGTHRLERGNFLKPAEAVAPAVPAFLHPLPPDAPRNRLGLARWLVDRRSPTTARTIVNRVWQAYFGTGIVGTPEDLGSQCEAPSHPELLDYLAVDLVDHGWSLKHLHRQIVSSATFRQSSRTSDELAARDPYNRLLARGPRVRVEAEVVRDIALAASGLVNLKVGGPPAYPPAPDFLFLPPASYGPKVWKEDVGENRYRRALYTFRFRSVPYPVLQNFDAPNGDFACVRRSRSNTPLQALTTLNEVLFVECARALALRTVQEGGSADAERLKYAFRRCVARPPTADEAQVLLDLLARQTQRYAGGQLDPWQLAANDPANPPALPAGTSPAQLAGWTAVARVLLNLDETVTKE